MEPQEQSPPNSVEAQIQRLDGIIALNTTDNLSATTYFHIGTGSAIPYDPTLIQWETTSGGSLSSDSSIIVQDAEGNISWRSTDTPHYVHGIDPLDVEEPKRFCIFDRIRLKKET